MLKLSNLDNPVEITEDLVNKNLYRLKWADGVISEDFYNRGRASDILTFYSFYRSNMNKRTEDWI